MVMASLILHRFPWVYLALAVLIAFFPAASPSSSIYDHLQVNGLPIGLFPKGISDFSVDPLTHRFLVHLPHPCNARFESQVHYDLNVSGVLTFGKIDQLSGMSHQELFLWFPVMGIRVDDPTSGLIHFDVGVVDKQFSLSLFENPRDCTAADPPRLLTPQDQRERIGKARQESILRATS